MINIKQIDLAHDRRSGPEQTVEQILSRQCLADDQRHLSFAVPVADWSQCGGAASPCYPRYGLRVTTYAIGGPGDAVNDNYFRLQLAVGYAFY